MKIVFTGTGSTGKSTLLKELQNNPKFNNGNIDFIDSITETAKKMGYKINENGTDETQLAIAQIHKDNIENSEINKRDFVASRCMLDCYCYSRYLYNTKQIKYGTMRMIEEYLRELYPAYDIVFYIRPEFDRVENGLRSTNQEFVDSVAKIFENTIKEKKLDVCILRGTVKERMKQIYAELRRRNHLYE
jgi:thymidylate kinase